MPKSTNRYQRMPTLHCTSRQSSRTTAGLPPVRAVTTKAATAGPKGATQARIPALPGSRPKAAGTRMSQLSA
jgi:hypothetical protein